MIRLHPKSMQEKLHDGQSHKTKTWNKIWNNTALNTIVNSLRIHTALCSRVWPECNKGWKNMFLWMGGCKSLLTKHGQLVSNDIQKQIISSFIAVFEQIFKDFFLSSGSSSTHCASRCQLLTWAENVKCMLFKIKCWMWFMYISWWCKTICMDVYVYMCEYIGKYYKEWIYKICIYIYKYVSIWYMATFRISSKKISNSVHHSSEEWPKCYV